MKNTLEVKDLYAKVDNKEILKGVNLTINSGEVHAIMGPNGTGKSTLSQVIMGHPKYEVISGSITFNGEDVLNMEVDERAKAGLFLGMQYPAEIPGITNSDFLRSASNNLNEGKTESLVKFIRQLEGSVTDLKMPNSMISRSLNDGFSGGEKKKNEILQLKVLQPKLAILDEIDSGLDIDALSTVGENLTKEIESRKEDLSLLMITHYQRMLDYIKPTHVHIMLGGKIVETGGAELAKILEQDGYEKYKKKYNIQDEEAIDFKNQPSIKTCATKMGVENGQNS